MRKIIYALLGLVVVAIVGIVLVFDTMGKKSANNTPVNCLKRREPLASLTAAF